MLTDSTRLGRYSEHEIDDDLGVLNMAEGMT